MATSELRDRLQPALLDRLTDQAPHQRLESESDRVMTKSQLRQAVLRDLGWLFNATQPQPQWASTMPPMQSRPTRVRVSAWCPNSACAKRPPWCRDWMQWSRATEA